MMLRFSTWRHFRCTAMMLTTPVSLVFRSRTRHSARCRPLIACSGLIVVCAGTSAPAACCDAAQAMLGLGKLPNP